jgi:RNA polymerase sigma-70 factor (ECF subfamily)
METQLAAPVAHSDPRENSSSPTQRSVRVADTAAMLSPALPLSDDTESMLLARWRTGDRAAGLYLLRREVQPIRRYFSRRVPCQADAEDLVQRTLLASIDGLPRFREDVDLSRFVRAIASKLLLRYRRDGERARVRLDADVQPDAMQAGQPSALTWICHEDDVQRLQDAFRELPDGSARLLQLRYWEERDTSEIARLLEVNPGAVRTRLHRARHEIKRVLAARMGSAGGLAPRRGAAGMTTSGCATKTR